MRVSNTIRSAATAGFLAALAAAPALAATSGYSETWDNQGDLAGWFGSTTDSTVVNPGAGGNPGGFLEVRRGGDFEIGVTTDLPAVAGSYSGSMWKLSVDLTRVAGDVSDIWLRYRYQDSSFNGWHLRLGGDPGAGWVTGTVMFDADWSDADAMLNGWEQEAAGPNGQPGWAQTMSNTYHPEVRFAGSRTLLVGVDNFSITAVPEPSTYALIVLGLVGVSAAARRRRQPS